MDFDKTPQTGRVYKIELESQTTAQSRIQLERNGQIITIFKTICKRHIY
jgi:hypothetical protein